MVPLLDHSQDWCAEISITGLGKEKVEELSGEVPCTNPTLHTWLIAQSVGLTDKEIEDRVTGLVKTEI